MFDPGKRIEFLLTARDHASKVFDNLAARMPSLKTAVAAVGAAVVAVGIALAAITSQSLQLSTQYESRLVDMAKVTSRSLGQIDAEIKSLDSSLGSSAELMAGYYQVISSGVTEPVAALQLLKVASAAAKAGHLEQSEVIKGVTKMMAGFAGEVKTAIEATDLLFKTEQLGQTSFAELVPVIGGLSSLSKTLTVNSREMAGSLALITQTAGDTSEAATGYEAVLTALIKPTTDMIALLKAHGYATAEAAIADRGFVGVLELMQSYTGGSSVKLGELLGRKEAIKTFVALSADGFGTVKDYIEQMGDATGKTTDAFDRFRKSSEGLTEELRNNLNKEMLKFGDSVSPARNNAIIVMTGAIKDLGAALDWTRDRYNKIDGANETLTNGIRRSAEMWDRSGSLMGKTVNYALQKSFGYIEEFNNSKAADILGGDMEGAADGAGALADGLAGTAAELAATEEAAAKAAEALKLTADATTKLTDPDISNFANRINADIKAAQDAGVARVDIERYVNDQASAFIAARYDKELEAARRNAEEKIALEREAAQVQANLYDALAQAQNSGLLAALGEDTYTDYSALAEDAGILADASTQSAQSMFMAASGADANRLALFRAFEIYRQYHQESDLKDPIVIARIREMAQAWTEQANKIQEIKSTEMSVKLTGGADQAIDDMYDHLRELIGKEWIVRITQVISTTNGGGSPVEPSGGGAPAAFHDGTHSVGRTGLAILEEGEAVIPKEKNIFAEKNGAFTGEITAQGGNSISITLQPTFKISGANLDPDAILQHVDENLAKLITSDRSEVGQAFKAITVRKGRG